MSPPSYNTPPIEDMILIKREAGPPSSDGYTPSEFSIPDSSTPSVVNVVSQISQKQSTMWEDIASSIKKLDPDCADALQLMTPPSFTSSNASGGGSVLILDTSNHVVMHGSEHDSFQLTPTSNAHHPSNYSQQ